MSGVNMAVVLGNLGSDPDMRYTTGGTAYCRFSVATDEKWKDSSGELKEKTTWHRIVVWGRQAELCNEHLHKGAKVHVVGQMEHGEYEKDGQTVRTFEIKANPFGVTFVETDRNRRGGGGQQQGGQQQGGGQNQGWGQGGGGYGRGKQGGGQNQGWDQPSNRGGGQQGGQQDGGQQKGGGWGEDSVPF